MEVSDGESATILMGVHYYFGHRENLFSANREKNEEDSYEVPIEKL
jgi:hypothetical protein